MRQDSRPLRCKTKEGKPENLQVEKEKNDPELDPDPEGDNLANAPYHDLREAAGTQGDAARRIGGRWAKNPLAANAINALQSAGAWRYPRPARLPSPPRA